MASRTRRSKRPPKSRLLLRWLGVGAICLVAFLYYRPAQTYFARRHQLGARVAEVRSLRSQHVQLQRLVAASTSDAALAQEARRLGLVRPGERLFIVKGIDRWFQRHPVTLRNGG
jgi:cell division protein FtsB